jgi:hypothetical protein
MSAGQSFSAGQAAGRVDGLRFDAADWAVTGGLSPESLAHRGKAVGVLHGDDGVLLELPVVHALCGETLTFNSHGEQNILYERKYRARAALGATGRYTR